MSDDKLIIHDLGNYDFEQIVIPALNSKNTGEIRFISGTAKINSCLGCLRCWVKTPGKCVIPDKCQSMSFYLATCSNIIVISQCWYGSYSPQVKSILDRSISYFEPSFTILDGRMHYRTRYKNKFSLNVIFYGGLISGSISDREMNTARRLVSANAVSFNCCDEHVAFVDSVHDLGEVLGSL